MNFENPKFDIIILGNSLALDGIDAEFISENYAPAYNMSIAGASVRTSLIQMQEYLENYNHKPKTIILAQGSYIGMFDTLLIHPVVDITLKNKRFGLKDLPFKKFQWLFENLLKKAISSDHRNAKIVAGQLKFDKVVADKSKPDYEKRFLKEIYTENKYIQEMIEICESQDIDLVAIEMPGYAFVRHKKEFDCIPMDKNKTAFLYDFNTFEFSEIFNSKLDWVGNSHLNVRGARKFTSEFMKIINSDITCE